MKVNTDNLVIGGVTVAAVGLAALALRRMVVNAKIKKEHEAFDKEFAAVQKRYEEFDIYKNSKPNVHINPEGLRCKIKDVN